MTNHKKSVAVLVSGGIDSSLLLAEVAEKAEEVFPIYIRSGYRWEKAELHWLERFLDKLDVPMLTPLIILDMPMRDIHANHWSMEGEEVPDRDSYSDEVYLPGRNLLLASKASVFCDKQKIDTLALGLLKGNPFPDATPAFFKNLNAVIDVALHTKLKIETPYLNKSKTEIMKRSIKSIPLHLTFSCLNPVEFYHCGVCNKCAERQKAFAEIGAEDPTGYVEIG